MTHHRKPFPHYFAAPAHGHGGVLILLISVFCLLVNVGLAIYLAANSVSPAILIVHASWALALSGVLALRGLDILDSPFALRVLGNRWSYVAGYVFLGGAFLAALIVAAF